MLTNGEFDKLLYIYKCGNLKYIKQKLKKMSRKDRGLVVRWLSSYTSTKEEIDIAIKFALWIIEGEIY